MAGIFAGRPEGLSVRASLPRLYALEEKYGGLIKGMIMGSKERKERSEKAKDRAETFSFKNGMQALPSALARRLGTRIITGATVNSIAPTQGAHTTDEAGRNRYTISYGRNVSEEIAIARSLVFSEELQAIWSPSPHSWAEDVSLTW